MNAEQQKQKFEDGTAAIDEMLDSIQLVRGEDYQTKVLALYSQMLTAKLGHLHGLPTADLGVRGMACQLKSWGHSNDATGNDLARDASALVAKSIWAL